MARQIFGILLAFLFPVLVAAGFTGCAGSKKNEDMVVVEQGLEAVRIVQGIELRATAQGASVRIEITNRNDYPMLVGPRCFAVIPKGQRKVVPFNIATDDYAMPVQSLSRDAGLQGIIRFASLNDLIGARLLFQSADPPMKQPVSCEITPPRVGTITDRRQSSLNQ